MPYKDKAKQRLSQHRSYLRHKAKVIGSGRYNRMERRKSLALLVQEAKRQPCVDCKIEYPYYVMDLDHVRGIKIGAVSAMVHETVPIQMLLDEIDKCDVVCANCHRERTFSRIDNPIVGDGAPLETV